MTKIGVLSCFIGTPKRGKKSELQVIYSEDSGAALNQVKDKGKIDEAADGNGGSEHSIPVRIGGSSIDSCGSTNVPHHQSTGYRTWAQLSELADEIAELKKRLQLEENESKKLRDEVLNLRTNNEPSSLAERESYKSSQDQSLKERRKGSTPTKPIDLITSKDSVNTPEVKSTEGFLWSPTSNDKENTVEKATREDISPMQRDSLSLLETGSEYCSCDSLEGSEWQASKGSLVRDSSGSLRKTFSEREKFKNGGISVPPDLPKGKDPTKRRVNSSLDFEDSPKEQNEEKDSGEKNSDREKEGENMGDGNDSRREEVGESMEFPNEKAEKENPQEMEKVVAKETRVEADPPAKVPTKRVDSLESDPSLSPAIGLNARDSSDSIVPLKSSLDSDVSFALLPRVDSSDTAKVEAWGGFKGKRSGETSSSSELSFAKVNFDKGQPRGQLPVKRGSEVDFEFKSGTWEKTGAEMAEKVEKDKFLVKNAPDAKAEIEKFGNSGRVSSEPGLYFKERSPQKLSEEAIEANKTVWESDGEGNTENEERGNVELKDRNQMVSTHEIEEENAPSEEENIPLVGWVKGGDDFNLRNSGAFIGRGRAQKNGPLMDSNVPNSKDCEIPVTSPEKEKKVLEEGEKKAAENVGKPISPKQSKIVGLWVGKKKSPSKEEGSEGKKKPQEKERRVLEPVDSDNESLGIPPPSCIAISKNRSPRKGRGEEKKGSTDKAKAIKLNSVAIKAEEKEKEKTEGEVKKEGPSGTSSGSSPKVFGSTSKSSPSFGADSSLGEQNVPPLNLGGEGENQVKTPEKSVPLSPTKSRLAMIKSSLRLAKSKIKKGKGTLEKESPELLKTPENLQCPPQGPNPKEKLEPSESGGGGETRLSKSRQMLAKLKARVAASEERSRRADSQQDSLGITGGGNEGKEAEEVTQSKPEIQSERGGLKEEKPANFRGVIEAEGGTKVERREAPRRELIEAVERALEQRLLKKAVAEEERKMAEKAKMAQEMEDKKVEILIREGEISPKLKASPKSPRNFQKWIGDGLDIKKIKSPNSKSISERVDSEMNISPTSNTLLLRRSWKGPPGGVLRDSLASAGGEEGQQSTTTRVETSGKVPIRSEQGKGFATVGGEIGEMALKHDVGFSSLPVTPKKNVWPRITSDTFLTPEKEEDGKQPMRLKSTERMPGFAKRPPSPVGSDSSFRDSKSKGSSVQGKGEKKWKEKLNSPRSPKQRLEKVNNWLEGSFREDSSLNRRVNEPKVGSTLEKKDFSPAANSVIDKIFASSTGHKSPPVSPRSVRRRAPISPVGSGPNGQDTQSGPISPSDPSAKQDFVRGGQGDGVKN